MIAAKMFVTALAWLVIWIGVYVLLMLACDAAAAVYNSKIETLDVLVCIVAAFWFATWPCVKYLMHVAETSLEM